MVKELKSWIMEILDVVPDLDPYNISLAMHNKHSADEIAQAMYELEKEGKLPERHWVAKKYTVVEVEKSLEPEILLHDKSLEEIKTDAEEKKRKRKEK